MSTSNLPQPSETEPSALLRIDALHLELPQSEVCALVPLSEVDLLDARPFSVGWVQHGQHRCPVYCLSAELSLLIVIPPKRRTCVLLASGDGFIGILCDEASTINLSPADRHSLPSAMRLRDTPILSLIALGEDQIACATSAGQLATHVMRLTGL